MQASSELLVSPLELDPAVWFDASDLDGDFENDSSPAGTLSSWVDKSGNSRTATVSKGTPELNVSGGPNGGRVIEFRSGFADASTGDEELAISGTFFIKDHFYVLRSPHSTWSDYGGIIGHDGSGSGEDRNSNFIFERSNTYFHGNQYPDAVWKNGLSIASSNFDLGTINEYMILRIVVNDNDTSAKSTWSIGNVSADWSMDMDLAEAVCFSTELSEDEAGQIEGYLAHKWNLNSKLPVEHLYQDLSSRSIDTLPLRDLTIGGNDPSSKFSGTIDEVRIYERSLSSSEIATLYLDGTIRFQTSDSAQPPKIGRAHV